MKFHSDLLRLVTCGSVDDGKSTLIGRILYECGAIPDDQLQSLVIDSRKYGTTGEDMDFALLVDGLEAEREQGITIDVAYRYFATVRRRFIVADTPGHEQYTRNMATGASNSDLAVILVDARKGFLTQTRRHAAIISLFELDHVVLAVNKMDLVDFDERRFNVIKTTFEQLAAQLGIATAVTIPVAARLGDNVTAPSDRMSWYRGPTLLGHLESVELARKSERAFRLPVQRVNRPDQNFRGFSGTIYSGEIRVGDGVAVMPSGQGSQVTRLFSADREVQHCAVGDAVTLLLADEVDVSRGDVISEIRRQPMVSDQIAAHLIWMSDEPMLPGRAYLLKCGTQTVSATISTLKHKVSVDTLEEVAGRSLALNDIGFCNISTARPIVFDPFSEGRLGAFILIDKFTFATVGAGLIRFELRRATNIQWQALDVTNTTRAALKGQKACCLWFTGLSGAGKSTIANLLDKRLTALGKHTFVLDGDNVRHGLNRDLGFTDTDRVENIRRIAEVARLMVHAGLIVMVAVISPFRDERQMARELFEPEEFLEIYVDTPLEVCEKRDPKGLYRKARRGQLQNFTGIDSTYEPPGRPEVRLSPDTHPPEQLVDELFQLLQMRRTI